MEYVVTKSPLAILDLVELGDFIAQDSLPAAERFIEAAQSAFELLARMPEIGTRCQFRAAEAVAIRVWPIRGFENYLVFYRPIQAGVEVVRVLHGSRDVAAMFNERPAP
jgi:toxin ParE1/3/4